MISDKEAIDLYEATTGDTILGWDDEEVHEIIDSVRRVREAQSEEEAMSAILYWGHHEDWTRAIVHRIKSA